MSNPKSQKMRIRYPQSRDDNIVVEYSRSGNITVKKEIKSLKPYDGEGFGHDSIFLPEDMYYIAFPIDNFLVKDDEINFLGKSSGGNSLTGSVVNYLYDAVMIRTDPTTGKRFCFVKFQFFDDKNGFVIRDRSPQYTPINLFSRYEPIQMWSGGSEIGIDLNLRYVAVDPYKYNELWVDRMASLIKALSQPNYYGGSQFRAPPILRLKIGDLIDDLPVIITKFSRVFEERQFTSPYGLVNNEPNNHVSTPYPYKKASNINGTAPMDKPDPTLPQNGVHLPKIQTLSLTFVSSYPLNKQVDFMVAAKREECVRFLKDIVKEDKNSIKQMSESSNNKGKNQSKRR